MGQFEKIIYSLCLLNVVICLVMAPFQLFYITIILRWQEDCSLILLLCSIWCSAVFTCIAVLHFYIVYNKHREHWNGLNKNMRFLAAILFVIFGQMIGLLFAKYRLTKLNENKFKSAMRNYYSTTDSTKVYIDSTQIGGQCCGYYNKYDWDVRQHIPPSCCLDRNVTCTAKNAFQMGCQKFFNNLIRDATDVPLITSMVLLLSALTIYICIMTFLQFSGVYEYEEIPSNTFEESIVEGTHQSWRSSRHSINDSDITPARPISRDTGYGSRTESGSRAGSARAGTSRDTFNGGPQVIVSRDPARQTV